MIRITQSYLINQTVATFIKEGWSLLYKDIPGGRRSGVGVVASINKIWEGLYNLSPDIVFENKGIILLLEVDKKLNEEYLEKFNKYFSKEYLLKEKLTNIISKEITRVEFGFVSKNDKYDVVVNNHLKNFNFIYYKNGIMIRSIINPS